MNCPRCGAEVEPGSVFCGECGFRLPVQQPPQQPVQREPEPVRSDAWQTGRAPVFGPADPFHLSILEGPEKGKSFELTRDMRIGRGTDNDIVLTDLRVSRQHGMISARGQDYLVADVGSPNGVFVNSVRIAGPQTLKEGDRIRMGDTVMVFSASPVSAPPVPQPAAAPVRQRPTPPPPPPMPARQPIAAPPPPPVAAYQPADYAAPAAPAMPEYEIVNGRRVIRAVRQGGTPTGRWITYSCSLILVLILLAVVLLYLVATRVQVTM